MMDVREVRRGQYWKDANGQFRVMCVADGYAMCRRRGAMPFVLFLKTFSELTRLHVAKPATTDEARGL